MRIGTQKKLRKTINCDEVHWMLQVFERYLPKDEHPAVSQKREMMKYAMLYEVMDVAGLGFEDDSAVHNARPSPVRNLISEYAETSEPLDANGSDNMNSVTKEQQN